MLIYYPLEHLYYFASHSILPARITPPSVTNNKIALWSCRAWAVYVVLQFMHLREDWRLARARERALKRNSGIMNGTGEGAPSLEGVEVAQRKSAIWNEFLVNVGYLPLTIHWYVFCSLATIFSFYCALCTILCIEAFSRNRPHVST